MFRLPTLRKKREKLPPKFGTDLRSLGPVHLCPCGSSIFEVLVQFHDYEICWWYLDAHCANCGNIVTVPCPADKM
jgi:hypothetical protein